MELKYEYYLKYKDIPVIYFNTQSFLVEILDEERIPFSISGRTGSFDLIRIFCACRLLMLNREHCKEILTACGIDDQTDLNICLVSRALSFRDCYWICAADSDETWSQVNLFKNEFSANISKVALTGDISQVSQIDAVGDHVYTGELTSKGVRAKCFFRQSDQIFLAKRESIDEIASEIVSSYVARCIGLNSAVYIYAKLFDQDCSVCHINTSEAAELVPCRDILMHYQCKMSSESDYYKLFMQIDPLSFMKMQLFDYVTLNVDRNRDNFGLLSRDGKLISLYPVFDQDCCFKGKSVDAVYFPTNLTFGRTLNFLRQTYAEYYSQLTDDIKKARRKLASDEGREFFLRYKSQKQYRGMMERVEDLLQN